MLAFEFDTKNIFGRYQSALSNGHGYLLADGFFFFGFHFLNGLGGRALFGIETIVFMAFRNFSNASGPSIISGSCFMPL